MKDKLQEIKELLNSLLEKLEDIETEINKSHQDFIVIPKSKFKDFKIIQKESYIFFTYFDCVFRVDSIEDVYAEYMEGTLKYIVITKLDKTSSIYLPSQVNRLIVTHQLLTKTQAAQKKYYTDK
jgi:hypothetical protein